jgi:NAD(P)H-dependent flavin oxidoreductase YrpB (nitropropane dioxygenase family)
VGTVEEARRAIADGVDGLIAQGNEAGGHLLGVEPTVTFLAKALEVAGGRPVLAAGGVATAQDTRQLLDAGAEAVVAGTRFLLTEECRAHRTYKQRVLDAEQTLETKLFSVGWIDRHRVVPNAATQRWCSAKPDGPRAVLAANRVLAPVLQRLPAAAATATLKLQRTGVPFFGPGAALEGMPESVVDVTPLYAGESALGIDEVLPAARAVELLAP